MSQVRRISFNKLQYAHHLNKLRQSDNKKIEIKIKKDHLEDIIDDFISSKLLLNTHPLVKILKNICTRIHYADVFFSTKDVDLILDTLRAYKQEKKYRFEKLPFDSMFDYIIKFFELDNLLIEPNYFNYQHY